MPLNSPSGLVKVARAGACTSVLAVFLTLLEVAAKGRAITKMALPTTVATKQTGRTTSASAAVAMLSAARALGVHRQPMSARHRREGSFDFIVVTRYGAQEGLSNPFPAGATGEVIECGGQPQFLIVIVNLILILLLLVFSPGPHGSWSTMSTAATEQDEENEHD